MVYLSEAVLIATYQTFHPHSFHDFSVNEHEREQSTDYQYILLWIIFLTTVISSWIFLVANVSISFFFMPA